MNATERPWERLGFRVVTSALSLHGRAVVAECWPDQGDPITRPETDEEAAANIDLIVRAVNSYDPMRKALRNALNVIYALRGKAFAGTKTPQAQGVLLGCTERECEAIRTVLAMGDEEAS